MSAPRLAVLFLCTGNSARSQLAAALLSELSRGRIDAVSAGTSLDADVHPLTREVLHDRYGIDASTLQPTPVERFLDRHFDVVITVCEAAAETCPVFPNAGQRVHWSFDDPAAVPPGPGQRRAFERIAHELVGRIRLWMSLPDIARRIAAS